MLQGLSGPVLCLPPGNFFQRILFSALTLLGIKRLESTALHLVSFYARVSS